MPYVDNANDDIANALRDWLDFERTPRKIIARRQSNRSFLAGEAVAMRSAKELVDEGRISIITSPAFDRYGRGVITYIAERVK